MWFFKSPQYKVQGYVFLWISALESTGLCDSLGPRTVDTGIEVMIFEILWLLSKTIMEFNVLGLPLQGYIIEVIEFL